jgi:hypothetical protein
LALVGRLVTTMTNLVDTPGIKEEERREEGEGNGGCVVGEEGGKAVLGDRLAR